MKNILILVSFFGMVFSQSMDEMLSPEIFEPEKKPNWNSSFERFDTYVT